MFEDLREGVRKARERGRESRRERKFIREHGFKALNRYYLTWLIVTIAIFTSWSVGLHFWLGPVGNVPGVGAFALLSFIDLYVLLVFSTMWFYAKERNVIESIKRKHHYNESA